MNKVRALGLALTLGLSSGWAANASEFRHFIQDWQPEQVQLTCPSGDCPAGVGLLTFVRKETAGLSLERCTASLIDPTHILTSDHCELNGFERAHFIARSPNGTIHRALVAKEFSARGHKSGVGRDLAIWSLDQPISELTPVNVARRIADNLDRVVIYKVDPKKEGDFTQFRVVRSECRTQRHVPVLSVGVADRAIGLALRDCDVQRGNSGAPGFAADDLNAIQVVINSVWRVVPGPGHTVADMLGLWFLGPLPEPLRGEFAMGERVHCLPVAGQPAPSVFCGVNESVHNLISKGRKVFLQSEYPLQPGPGVAWGFRLVDLVFLPDGLRNPKFAVALIPYPVCINPGLGPGSIEPPPIRYYQIGFDKQERLMIKAIEEIQVSDAGALVTTPLPSRLRFARGGDAKWKKWLQLPESLVACQDVYERARSEALADAERFYLFEN